VLNVIQDTWKMALTV